MPVNAPRELIGASGAKLTEMPWHADRGLCCGAGGARMWMEEHIGKRVNHERVEEALDTCASKIATGCPFCRVMMTDGVDDVAAANGVPKAEVLDVAQLLLCSLDKSSVTLPEKGTAAKAAEERAARVEASTPTVENKAPVEAPQEEPAEAKASTATETKPVTGLGIAGGRSVLAQTRRQRRQQRHSRNRPLTLNSVLRGGLPLRATVRRQCGS